MLNELQELCFKLEAPSISRAVLEVLKCFSKNSDIVLVNI